MKKAIGHLRANAIAYLALFVALGGTSYAAISIPAGSVGTRQLRNGAVTAKKLDRDSIAGYVAFWARILQNGFVVASSAPATVSNWSTGTGEVMFRGDLSSKCFALANGTGSTGFGYAVPQVVVAGGGHVGVSLTAFPVGGTQPAPIAVAVAVICPT